MNQKLKSSGNVMFTVASAALFLLAFFLNNHSVSAQIYPDTIRVQGTVREGMGQRLSNIIIINQRTKHGEFGGANGTFSLSCRKTDTLSVTSLGYFSKKICFKDSVAKPIYFPIIYLEERTYTLPQAEIFAPRDLEKIQQDISKLGYDESDYTLSGINALSSPITFLYLEFSRKEQSRRLAIQLQNEDNKRQLLKELFYHYIDYQIIDLSDDEFDEFINFIHVSDDFLKSTSQYNFLLFVKERFQDYKIMKRQKRLKAEDYEYDSD